MRAMPRQRPRFRARVYRAARTKKPPGKAAAAVETVR
jgi:hypothetical protein